MPILNEKLHRGLWTRLSALLMPEGGLRAALNARYHRGDVTLWQAEGRRRVTAATSPSKYSNGAGQTVGMGWDSGTIVPNQPAGYAAAQIVGPGTAPRRLDSRPALDDPTAGAMADAVRTQLMLPTNQRTWSQSVAERVLDVGPQSARVVHFEGRNVLLSGGEQNLVLRKNTTSQTLTLGQDGVGGATQVAAARSVYVAPHGLPLQTLVPIVTKVSAGATTLLPRGFHFFWFTWYSDVDVNDPMEGTCGTGAAGWVLVIETGTNYRNLRVSVDSGLFNAAIPPFVNKIRLYKAKTHETDAVANNGALTPLTSPFPFGYLMPYDTGELTITAVMATRTADATFPSGFRYDLGTFTSGGMRDEDLNVPFPTVSLTTEDASPRNVVPPGATTGDVMGESLLLNDVSNPQVVRWSPPGEPYAFPALYTMWFPTAERDEVVAIRTLDKSVGVFQKRSVWRINWLPQDGDAGDWQGQAQEPIAFGRGAVGDRAVTRFDSPVGLLLAAVDRLGVYATDLDTLIPLTDHIDWGRVLQGGNIGNAALLNQPDEERLELWVGTEVWYIHYDAVHWNEGRPAVTGPITRPGTAWAQVVRTVTGAARVVTAQADGRLFYDGLGTTEEASGLPMTMLIETRDLYPMGVGKEARSLHLLGHVRPLNVEAAAGNWLIGLWGARQAEPAQLVTSHTLSGVSDQLLQVPAQHFFERCYLTFAGQTEGVPVGIDLLGVNVEDLGDGG